MPAYHQMGHNSQNLLGEIDGFTGAIVSPVNDIEADVAKMIEERQSEDFEFVFDPQLYFPNRADRGQLGKWSYFPSDLDTADVFSTNWSKKVVRDLAKVAKQLKCKAVCSPGFIAQAYTNEYYEDARDTADSLAGLTKGSDQRVLATTVVRLADLTIPDRSLEIASIVSAGSVSEVYLVLLSDVKPRDELKDPLQIKGAMRLIHALETSGLKVLVGFSSTDLMLWKAAGATSCASGKFANLRRFTASRFDEDKDGGSQMAYWCEETLLAFIRQNDLVRMQKLGLVTSKGNPFGEQILKQLAEDPAKPWVGLGWRQYLHWFATMEARLAESQATAVTLIKKAEKNWLRLEDENIFMDEPRNNGQWLRPWLQSCVEFKQ